MLRLLAGWLEEEDEEDGRLVPDLGGGKEPGPPCQVKGCPTGQKRWTTEGQN